MGNCNPLIKKLIVCFLTISLFGVAYSPETKAQYPGINDSIAKYRKGQLIIKAKRGSKVTVEQMRKDCWLGVQNQTSLAGGRRRIILKQSKKNFWKISKAAVTKKALSGQQ